ncbi:MAG: hypothetical protein PHC69_10775 [Ruminiclostridium sp.]|nr:hypothetical protein [Ruminiclostridium sp.]
MAYAIVLAEREKEEGKKCRLFGFFSRWLKSFAAAEIIINKKEIREGFCLHIVTMPHPDYYLTKNKHGRKKTMRSWFDLLKENQINNYLLDNTLTKYIEGGWDGSQKDFLRESLEQKVHILFGMEPLKSIDYRMLTIAISGIKNKHKTKELLNLLKRFRNVNTIEGDENDSWWEDFMTETGVPVCKSTDHRVLERSDVWLSFNSNDMGCFFNGIKVDIPGKKIIYTGTNKQYKMGYDFPRQLISILGTNLVRRFGYELLSNFLLFAQIEGNGHSLNSAEKILDININFDNYLNFSSLFRW